MNENTRLELRRKQKVEIKLILRLRKMSKLVCAGKQDNENSLHFYLEMFRFFL